MKQGKRKHIPQRTCIGCRAVLDKKNLIRVVRTAEGISIDPTGKLKGRGAYIHNSKSCWEKAIKGSLEKALKIRITEDQKADLKNFAESLSGNEIESSQNNPDQGS